MNTLGGGVDCVLLEELDLIPTPEDVERVFNQCLLDFVNTEVNPGSRDREEKKSYLPAAVFKKSAELGLLNHILPVDAGGLGGERRTFGLLLEQLGYHCEDVTFASLLAMYADVPNTIYSSGRPDLIEEYVIPMAHGERFGTFAFTDQGEPLSFATTVRQDGTSYILSGEKSMQTGGALADTFITYARDEYGDVKILLVERDDLGVKVEPVSTLGMRSAGLTKLVLNEVKIPQDRLLFQSDGLMQSQLFLNDRRLFIICPLVGAMRSIIRDSIKYLRGTVREGRPLSEMQAVQAKLGQMVAKTNTSRAILHSALDLLIGEPLGPAFNQTITAAKYTIAENMIAIAEEAVRLGGWQGYSTQLPFERYLRAAIGAAIGQTAQGVLEVQLGINAVAQVELELMGGK